MPAWLQSWGPRTPRCLPWAASAPRSRSHPPTGADFTQRSCSESWLSAAACCTAQHQRGHCQTTCLTSVHSWTLCGPCSADDAVPTWHQDDVSCDVICCRSSSPVEGLVDSPIFPPSPTLHSATLVRDLSANCSPILPSQVAQPCGGPRRLPHLPAVADDHVAAGQLLPDGAVFAPGQPPPRPAAHRRLCSALNNNENLDITSGSA